MSTRSVPVNLRADQCRSGVLWRVAYVGNRWPEADEPGGHSKNKATIERELAEGSTISRIEACNPRGKPGDDTMGRAGGRIVRAVVNISVGKPRVPSA